MFASSQIDCPLLHWGFLALKYLSICCNVGVMHKADQSHNIGTVLEVSLSMSKFQVDPTKKGNPDLDSPLKVMPKYKILSQ